TEIEWDGTTKKDREQKRQLKNPGTTKMDNKRKRRLKNPGKAKVGMKQKRQLKNPEYCTSFFDFFNSPQVPEDDKDLNKKA
ncbi:hypothetical protein MKW94_018809, partial [Papaver nudicaule]|nr:hypothetical protein [Papaver nudicaule]